MDIFWNDTLQVSSLKNNKILDASGQCYVQPCCNDKKMQNDVCLHYAVTLIGYYIYMYIISYMYYIMFTFQEKETKNALSIDNVLSSVK